MDQNTLSIIVSNQTKSAALFEAQKRLVKYIDITVKPIVEIVAQFNYPQVVNVCHLTEDVAHLECVDLVHQEGMVQMDKFTVEPIYCVYENTDQAPFKHRHVSTILRHHYLFNQRPLIHLHFVNKNMHVYIQNEGNFMGYNQFFVQGPMDVLYFTQLTFNTYSLNKDTTQIYLSGMIEDESIYSSNLRTFFKNISFQNPDIAVNVGLPYKTSYYFDHYLNCLTP